MLRPKRYVLIGGVAFLIAAVLAQTPLYRQITLWMEDAVRDVVAQSVRFEDILVIDVDESTMAALADSVGAWPYPRNLYASMLDYLFNAGVRAVVFDMLLVEQRAGDDELSLALARHRNVWLAARGQDFSLAGGADYFAQLQRYAWPVAERVPATSWQDILLPASALGRHAGVGIISVNPDDDGVLRRIAPFHRAYGKTIPAMPVAAMYKPGGSPAVSVNGNTLRVGEHRWPLDDDGHVLIQVPRNRDFLRVESFSRVLAAATADPTSSFDPGSLRGRTVFIGSSAAVLGDYARLPIHGRTAGLGILALAFGALLNDLVLKPAPLALNLVLIALAAALPLLYTNRRVFSELMITMWAAIGIALAWTVHVAAFGWYAQMSDVVFAILLGLIVWLVQLALRFRTLYDERRVIWMQKLAADEASELKSRFLAHMTHELRTPLTAIIGYNRLLSESEHSAGQRAQYLAVVQRNGAHLLALINNLLDQAKIEAGQMSVECEPVRLAVVLEDCKQTLNALAREKNLALRVVCNDCVPEVLSLDSLRLTQILLNLTGNAIKFTQHGEVRVEVDWQDGNLLIDVADTGPGMSEQALARIFDAFAQADSTVTRNHGGTGLGLTISRSLAQKMGGEITARSKPGEGTVFSVRILAPQAQAALVAANDRKTQESAQFEAAVLLVDDTPDIRELVGLHLRGLGLTVTTANDGEQGVELALRGRPDLVLMDVEMPKLNGEQATRALREQGFTGVVLALTAHRDEALLGALADAGCDGVVAKPVTRGDLANAMDKHLARAMKPASH